MRQVRCGEDVGEAWRKDELGVVAVGQLDLRWKLGLRRDGRRDGGKNWHTTTFKGMKDP
jgi:hypothetical protein